MKKSAPINIVVHYPKSLLTCRHLLNHASKEMPALVIEAIWKTPCSKEMKKKLLSTYGLASYAKYLEKQKRQQKK